MNIKEAIEKLTKLGNEYGFDLELYSKIFPNSCMCFSPEDIEAVDGDDDNLPYVLLSSK